MLLAIVALSTFSDPDVYGGFELQDGPYPLRLTVYAETPAGRDRTIRLQTRRAKVNGRPATLRLVPRPGSELTLPKGAAKREIDYRLEPLPAGAWVDMDLTFAAGSSRPYRTGINRYFPPAPEDDAELKRIQAQYVGKPVWLYGGSASVRYGANHYDYFVGLRPLRVRSVTRGVPPGGAANLYTTRRPLVMTFAPIPEGKVGVRDEGRSFSAPPKPPPGTPSPIYLTVPTGLMLSESVSLAPPPAALRQKAARVETAMREFDLDFTKRKAEMLWTLGRPDVAKSWQTIFGQNEWSYSIAAPFTHVMKFRRGRLVARTMEGDLP
ncbi:MAG: hypothetical protein ACO1SV_02210 [Fimbriimonas sp.]